MAKKETSSAAQIQSVLTEQNASWSAGETSVSELSYEEKLQRLGYVPGPSEPSLEQREAIALAAAAELNTLAVGAPAAWNWRNASGGNFVTPVRDQGSCGSCVAFGTTAAVEATVRIHDNQPNLAIDLSEAELFYCVARSQGRTCAGPNGGWWVEPALTAYQSQGVPDETCYPYVAGDQNCTNRCADWQNRVRKIASWQSLNTAAAMKQWISTTGPLAACFSVYNDFYAYSSGVYRHVTGALIGGHCVCIVGYDDAAGCWICKNSWGPGWGEQGFFRIAYGDCGIDAVMWGVTIGGAVPSTGVPLYRYWNPTATDHFYTTNWAELGSGRYGWGYEGVQCFVAASQTAGTTPLYRYWNSAIGDHFYTTNWAELGSGRYGWAYEGVQCYVFPTQAAGSVPLYRYWNPAIGDHFYTTNWAELGAGRYGWNYESIQCYVKTSAALSGATDEVPSSFRLETGGPGSTLTSGEGSVSASFQMQGGDSTSTPTSFQTQGAAGHEDSATPSTFQTQVTGADAEGTVRRPARGNTPVIVNINLGKG